MCKTSKLHLTLMYSSVIGWFLGAGICNCGSSLLLKFQGTRARASSVTSYTFLCYCFSLVTGYLLVLQHVFYLLEFLEFQTFMHDEQYFFTVVFVHNLFLGSEEGCSGLVCWYCKTLSNLMILRHELRKSLWPFYDGKIYWQCLTQNF